MRGAASLMALDGTTPTFAIIRQRKLSADRQGLGGLVNSPGPKALPPALPAVQWMLGKRRSRYHPNDMTGGGGIRGDNWVSLIEASWASGAILRRSEKHRGRRRHVP